MKRKGFTLVELLAVIVVLAIISIITIPMIGNVIEESKKKALEQSVNGLVESARYYSIENDGTYEFLFDENKKGETINGKKLSYNGSINAEGKLYIDSEGDISLCLVDDKYYVYKNYNSGIYVGEVKDNSCIIGYDVLTNKYIAMLDDGTGQVSNVYSKDEVNNLIDSLEEKIANNASEINNIKSNIVELQTNLNSQSIQYNADTDSLDIYRDGDVIGSMPCGFQVFKFANTKGSDWVVNKIEVVPDGNNITFKPVNLSSGGGWSARYTKKVTVKNNTQLYYAVNGTPLHYSGVFKYSADGTNWNILKTFESGTGGSGSVILPAGDYYFMFNGWSNNNPTNSIFTTLEIR